MQENNITTFNIDVLKKGQYLYTDKANVSSRLATARQSLEIIRLIKTYVGQHKKILDVGCGDGTYTMELFKAVAAEFILGFDPADVAVNAAQKKVPKHQQRQILFKTINIYDIASHFKKGIFDVAVVRGVLHHLADAPQAIAEIAKVVDTVIVLEPNGYNPILKVIEKTSRYHTEHEEKSYWPPTLLSWFRRHGYYLVEQRFVCIVPYFCSAPLARLLKFIEPLFESIPWIHRFYAGTNVFMMRKEK
jgi:ubiquinone/menaquinone biosynthesis C-methylase UbiE